MNLPRTLVVLALFLFAQATTALTFYYTTNDTANENTTATSASSTKPYFIKQGDKFTVTSREALDLHDRLPVGTYTVGVNSLSGEYFLKAIESFDSILHNGKIYGDTINLADRILKTFLDREARSTGVLLAGEKGSGKTFLAKYVSLKAAEEYGIPTIVINQPLSGERFNSFIQSIQQPVVLLFDEFEKIYADNDSTREKMRRMDEEEEFGEYYSRRRRNSGIQNPVQDALLTLLDGVYPANMLFLLTTNDKHMVSTHMRNRPGRIYYVIDFTGLTADFVRDYCQDNLNDKGKIEQVVDVSALFESMNFDMLQAMVEEINRYGENPEEVLKYLNVRPEFASGSMYLVELAVDGNKVPLKDTYNEHWFGNPLVKAVRISYRVPKHSGRPNHANHDDDDDDPEDGDYGRHRSIEFGSHEIESIDALKGIISFWNEEKKARLVLKKGIGLGGMGRSAPSVGFGGTDISNLEKLLIAGRATKENDL